MSTNWNAHCELHRRHDGGGLLHNFKTIRSGSLGDLVRYVTMLPDDAQNDYAILKEGDRLLGIGEIRQLARQDDFPQ